MAEALAASVASNLLSKLGEYLFAPIGRQFGYVLCYKNNVKDLKIGVDKLEIARARLQHSVDEAKRDGKLIHPDIKNWLDIVENKAEEARNMLKDGEIAKDACFRGWLPNPVVRHPIGKKVKKMTEVIRGLHKESQINSNFQKVYYENVPTGIVTAAPSATRSVDEKDVLESRVSITEDVMKAIADGELYVIGVYGPGGVGKSKLLEDVKMKVRGEKLFDEVAMADESRDPDIRRIQGEIADALGLKLINVETIRGRADRLRERLECDPHKNRLIILDNLWKKLELKEVGIPCGNDNKARGCKLLLSSRSQEVLRTDMGSEQEFRVSELNREEAQRLFDRIVGDRVNDPEFKPMVDRVVNNCGGLPLHIVLLANKLKHGDLAVWRNALDIEGSTVKLHVEQNYNDLIDERIKYVFLVSALQSGRSSMRDLLIYSMGLGLYEKFSKTIEIARDRLKMDLLGLRDSSLLLNSDDKEWFKMHDVIAEVAISIASLKWNALVGREGDEFEKWSDDALRKCTAISFPRVGIEKIPEKLN